MKTALRIIGLALSALMGLWLLGHGIVLGVAFHHRIAESEDVLGGLAEASVFVAGGICVLSVVIEQINCWRTHRKEDSLI